MDVSPEQRLAARLPEGHPGAPTARRAVEVLRTDPRISSLWLVGSLGSGTADRFSDVDLLAVTTGSDAEHGIRDGLTDALTPVILNEVDFATSVLLTVVTPDWARIDVTLLRPGHRLPGLPEHTVNLFDRSGGDHEWLARTPQHPSAGDQATELVRILGLAPVVLGRDHLTTAVGGCGLLVTGLSALAATVTATQLGRGAMAAESVLDPAARRLLSELPPISQHHDVLVEFHRRAAETLLEVLALATEPVLPAAFVPLWAALEQRYRSAFGVELSELPAPLVAS